jgi:hypothetical protein
MSHRGQHLPVVRCECCGQLCIGDDSWTVRGFCELCRSVAYDATGRHEAARLFVEGPVPLAGQTTMEGIE